MDSNRYCSTRFENYKRANERKQVELHPSLAVQKNASKQDQPHQKDLSIWDCLILLLYAFFVPVLRKIIPECLLRIICQDGQQEKENERNAHVLSSSKKQDLSSFRSSCYSDFSQLNLNQNQVYFSPTFFEKSKPLYSSDEDEEKDYLEWGSSAKTLEISSAIDDYDIPFVRFFDNLLYFLNLWVNNYPLFVLEVKKSLKSFGESEPTEEDIYAETTRRSWSKERRPRLLKKVIESWKKRELYKRMTLMEGDQHRRSVLTWAILSRAVIFLLQYTTWNYGSFLRHNNDGFKFIPEESYGKILDTFVNETFGGFVNWDAHYFLHISVNGYTSENVLAFFPLLPMILYVPSRMIYFVLGFALSLSSIVIVLSVLFNYWIFVKCTKNIYEIARIWGNGSRELVTAASLFFVFNPASIFFSGLYTETLFCYLTSMMILSLFKGNYWTSLLCAGMSGLCRSNGILNVGFILAFVLQRQLVDKTRSFSFASFLCSSVFQGVLCTAPFIMFQVYGAKLFCDSNKLYDADPRKIPLYCGGTWGLTSTLPYQYVQEKYWNVGFLRYFQFKQIPNFLLALPVLYLLGKLSATVLFRTLYQIKMSNSADGLYFAAQAAHGIFLTFFCFLFVHVQVSTRMIMAACPYFFIYIADSYLVEMERLRNRKIMAPLYSHLLMVWCALYFIVGTIVFSLGLPWT